MELQLISQQDNPLLERTQIWAKISYQGPTPSRDQLREFLCNQLGSDPALTVLDRIITKYGTRECSVYLKIYRNPELMLRIERPQVLRRNKLIQSK